MLFNRSTFANFSCFLSWIFICLFFIFLFPVKADEKLKTIGVLAYDGKQQAIKRWQPTAEFLSEKIPQYRFNLKALTHEEFQHEINKGALDFLLTNPGHYVQLAVKAGATRLVTYQKRYEDQVLTKMSSVIFSRTDSGIQSLSDLRGKILAAVSKDAFGGYQLAQKEFLTQQIDIGNDTQIKWLGFPHADIVKAVVSGNADAGIVRAGVLEKMQNTGFDIGNLQILNEYKNNSFPYKHSTELYPEWPLARLPSTNSNLSKQVVLTLLQMPNDHPANIISGGAGWTIPLNYNRVHELFKTLQIEPYPTSTLTWGDFWSAYKVWLMVTFVLLLLSLVTMIRMFKVNNRLNMTQQSLHQQQNILEDTVKQRIDDLLKINQSLNEDIESRIAIEENMHDACDALQNLYITASRHDLSREQKLQSLLDMARQYLGANRALLSYWDQGKKQFEFSTVSPEGQAVDVPLSAETANLAISENTLQTHFTSDQWKSYIACPVNIDNNYQCLFEFITFKTVQGNVEENTDDNPSDQNLLPTEVHKRILHLLTFWIGNEMSLANTENRSDKKIEILQDRFSDISPREREVLKLLVQGESNKEMARLLKISPKTIELHRANLLKKTGSKSSIELVKMTIQSGLITSKT
ncbi:MAG: PhnD/SsuA/transferrin family substrate-binding protein [Cocleimonas sp.]